MSQSSTENTRLSQSSLAIDGNNLRIEDVEEVANLQTTVELSPVGLKQLQASRRRLENLLERGETIYGINTGFGKFKDALIDPRDSRQLQRNLVLSHAAGVGPAFDAATTRAIMLLRANALTKGFSGIRTEVVQLLLELLNRQVHPVIPEQGSLGASGDLAPLAHLALVLIGEGEAEFRGDVLAGNKALSKSGLKPINLEAKEGLALLNGTQVMSALGCLIVAEADRLAKMADIIAALSLEAQMGSAKPFAEEIQTVRPHPGQISSAANMRRLLEGSEIIASHADCGMVQDAYSLRCIPQVHGASRQAFRHAREVMEIEINSATDNPLVFKDDVLSAGNFHGQPLALVLDYLSMALSELANISERRTERLVNPQLSNGLPAFLTKYGGLNSGFMIAQYTAAALVSENKSFSFPACVDSIPTSANQEDHVSMGVTSGRKARMILNNARRVLAIELLCAAQGMDFRIDILKGHAHSSKSLPGPALQAAHQFVRKHIRHLGHDRELHKDIAAAEQLIKSGGLLRTVEAVIGTLN